jgi:hypothetical protein
MEKSIHSRTTPGFIPEKARIIARWIPFNK